MLLAVLFSVTDTSPMKNKARPKGDRNFIEEVTAKQQNVVWPDPVRNSRTLDEFFWRGSEHPTVVQRIAGWLVGSCIFSCGMVFLIFGLKEGSFLEVLFSTGILAFGARIFLSGFRRRGRKS
jgi:hypothetical protein